MSTGSFFNIIILIVGSLIFISKKILRCSNATMTLDLPLFDLKLNLTGVVMSVLMITGAVTTLIVLRNVDSLSLIPVFV